MVIDLFYYNGEEEVLEIRLNLLAPYVDRFILVEAKETFSGFSKPLYYQENKERFKKWDITHYVAKETEELKQMALLSPNIGNGEHYWVREFIQKESARNALTFLKDDDIVCISDVDEIWKIKDFSKDVIYKPKQLPYLYYFNQRTNEDWLGWTGTTICKYKFIKNGIINHIRTDSMTDYEVIENGGWHFNAIGGKQKKIDSFRHPVYYDDNVWAKREVNLRKDESDLPKYILDNKEKYAQYFL